MYAKDVLKRVKNMSGNSNSKEFSIATKGHVVAALIGAGVGMAISYQKKYDLIAGAFLGALGATILSMIFIDKQKNN